MRSQLLLGYDNVIRLVTFLKWDATIWCLEVSLCCFYHLFSFQYFFLTYHVQYFAQRFASQLYSQALNSDIIPQLHIYIMDNYSYIEYGLVIQLYGVSKCQFLTRPNVLTVLLEYIDLFQFEWQHKIDIWEGLPCLYHSILLYFILWIAIVVN